MFYLKYKDSKVFAFDPIDCYFKMLNKQYLPMCIKNLPDGYEMVRVFCRQRVLHNSRVYAKDILLACCLEELDSVSICLKSRALCVTDNYWIDASKNSKTWEEINIRNHAFDHALGVVALTGKADGNIGFSSEKIRTGELTVKGNHAKLLMWQKKGIYLYKNLSLRKIAAEIVSNVIAAALTLDSAYYSYQKFQDLHCSKCRIDNAIEHELLLCEDLLLFYGCNMNINSKVYEYIMEVDARNFILMQIFDYLTLNTNRNGENYGLLVDNGVITGLYPIFDHDACFKGKNDKEFYMVTGMSFAETLEEIRKHKVFLSLVEPLEDANTFFESARFKSFFLQYLTVNDYMGLAARSKTILGMAKNIFPDRVELI
ncbi:MAG: hypothetical protein J6A75_02305 [Lachnospiraceae bacterium]|nr:hypothetical protein [Lachnospiraceae bacterium]